MDINDEIMKYVAPMRTTDMLKADLEHVIPLFISDNIFAQGDNVNVEGRKYTWWEYIICHK